MTSRMQSAMIFAMERHAEQKRKYTGEPYWKHLAEVAAITQSASHVTGEMITAAWLHDTIEDTDVTEAEIRERFGDDVAEMVVGLTDVSKPEDGNRSVRKELDRDHLAKGDYRIQTIKVADLISNTSSIVDNDPSFAKLYLKEKRALLQVLIKADSGLVALAIQTLMKADMKLRYDESM